MRHKDSDQASLNLYYRLVHDRLGQGLGREISRAAVSWAAEHCPQARVTAMVDRVNTASLRTAVSAGLVHVGTRQLRDEPDSEPMLYLQAPTVESVARGSVDAVLQDAVVDLWVRVNDAGGSVGFLPGAARGDVVAAFDRTPRGRRRWPFAALRAPGARWPAARARPVGALAGFPYEHVAGLKRLMVDPTRRAATSAASCSVAWSASPDASCRGWSCCVSTTATVSAWGVLRARRLDGGAGCRAGFASARPTTATTWRWRAAWTVRPALSAVRRAR